MSDIDGGLVIGILQRRIAVPQDPFVAERIQRNIYPTILPVSSRREYSLSVTSSRKSYQESHDHESPDLHRYRGLGYAFQCHQLSKRGTWHSFEARYV